MIKTSSNVFACFFCTAILCLHILAAPSFSVEISFDINEVAIAEAAGQGLLDYTESGSRQRSRSYAMAYLANVAHHHPEYLKWPLLVKAACAHPLPGLVFP